MAVVNVTTFTVRPDRFEDALADNRKAKAILEKHGARNVRVLAGLVAGQATGTLAFIFEADDFASWGAVEDKFFADPEGMALVQSTGASAGPIPGFQSAVYVDVPL
jgi:hypothetical protein